MMKIEKEEVSPDYGPATQGPKSFSFTSWGFRRRNSVTKSNGRSPISLEGPKAQSNSLTQHKRVGSDDPNGQS